LLLAADNGATDAVIAATVGIGGSTVYRTKRRFVEGNLELALSEEPRPGCGRKLSGKEEALLVATACSNPPRGRARWTLELLAGAMVKLTEHSSLSRETVRRRLKENHLKPYIVQRTSRFVESRPLQIDHNYIRVNNPEPAQRSRADDWGSAFP
jgi:transposase